MKPVYVTPKGRYYVDMNPYNGAYVVKAWPSQQEVTERDGRSQAIDVANECEAEALARG